MVKIKILQIANGFTKNNLRSCIIPAVAVLILCINPIVHQVITIKLCWGFDLPGLTRPLSKATTHSHGCTIIPANGKLTREKFKPARARRSSPRKHNLCFVLSDYRLFFFISAYSSAPPRRLCKCTRGALQFRSRFPKDDDDHAKFPKARNIFSFFFTSNFKPFGTAARAAPWCLCAHTYIVGRLFYRRAFFFV